MDVLSDICHLLQRHYWLKQTTGPTQGEVKGKGLHKDTVRDCMLPDIRVEVLFEYRTSEEAAKVK
jgi:hypothetical protein